MLSLRLSTRAWHAWMARATVVVAALTAAPAAMAAFSLTTRWDSNDATKVQYEVDTNAGLVVKFRAYDNGVSTQSAGDISSLVYNGVQYQNQTKGSQLNSGADGLFSNVSAVSVSAEVISSTGAATPASTAQNGVLTGGAFIKITVTSNSANGGVLKHYYLLKSGESRVYLATWFSEEPDVLGLVRYIVRVPITALPNGPDAGVPGGRASNGTWPQDLRGTDTTVESSDVFGFSSSSTYAGQTRSKHYANQRLKDWTYFGGRNSAGTVGLWFYRDSHEGGSGGPFYRSLLNQITSTDNELTYIVNYGEAQTESFRLGVLNSYTLIFNDGTAPTAPDTSWFSLVGLQGYVAASGRGGVAGVGLSGTDSQFVYTVGLANAQAQYWATANLANNGFFKASGVLPGTYTLTVYKNELAVYTGTATVTAGSTTSLNTIAISGDPEAASAVWRIGQWDGTPTDLRNGDKLTTTHPSDVRLSSWAPGTFTVGNSANTDFPAYFWRDINSGQVVQFTLTSAQIKDTTVRIGITTARANGRPAISVNSWTSANPAASTQPSTRTLTVGTYRGNNTTYSFAVPASALVVGTNTLTINAIGGGSATGYLSPSFSVDAVDFLQ
ncbi:rhamnogalacturonan endolyase [Roseateles sp. YR242]|uniref:rhamnogalacturonan lyase B N-terminal domain-containing protein n=1 Tax=Roseateles sp. YR242 TaxID=1855305 RepID=UPI0008D0B504|nr:rhamnogalacturonan lyase B N-terminal domain-containing protein [Roseateles sp. YR242]SEK25880.1 rhamnogalacturonan endolyase [Roseateles sp. YR242]